MDRVEEIVEAMRVRPHPMFLFGLVALARQDYDGIMADLSKADKLFQIELTTEVATAVAASKDSD